MGRARNDIATALLPAAVDPSSLLAEHPWSLISAIVDSCQDAIIGQQLDGTITSWNPAASRIFGYRPKEMIGRSILTLIPGELRDNEPEILRKVRGGERIDRFETKRAAKDGSSIEVSLSISPLKDGSGRVIGILEMAGDISWRKKLENLLLESEKIAAAGRMAATIAHEINNPLEAVLNLVFLARHSCKKGSDTDRYLETAENEVERVSHIARTTLGYYRDRGTPTAVVLHELIEAALLIFESKLTARGIRIDRSFEDARPILVSRGEMMQVFANILANSVDAMPQGGTIRIGVAEIDAPTGHAIQVSIQDQGSGIEEKHLPRIFEPFFTTKRDVGTGIGLWVTQQLIENRGGHIAVTSSTAPGASGTRVVIDIPF